MDVKKIIELNNEKREELNDENLQVYEDMLIYIRLNFNRSEQQTEELLMELLDHLLDAQTEGRTAEEVFGSDPKKYCQELIDELPPENNKNTAFFLISVGLQFLAMFSLVNGMLGSALHYFFNLGSNKFSFSLGSGIVVILIYLLLASVSIILVLKWLKSSTFKKKQQKIWVEFLQLWVGSMLIIILFIFTPKIIPSFGTTISFPVITFAGIGVILYLIAKIIDKKVLAKE